MFFVIRAIIINTLIEVVLITIRTENVQMHFEMLMGSGSGLMVKADDSFLNFQFQ